MSLETFVQSCHEPTRSAGFVRSAVIRLLLVMVMLGCVQVQGADRIGPDGYPQVREVLQHAGKSFLNVPYLPEWRYSGDTSVRRDYEMVLDLWLPKKNNTNRFPVVLFIHGGAYQAGNKRIGKIKPLAEALLQRGIAFGSMNYILNPRGIRPQVWFDYRDAARYLRQNAEKYQLDPLSFGSIGYSAGGWLNTTAGFGTGEGAVPTRSPSRCLPLDMFRDGQSQIGAKSNAAQSVWVPMQAEEPGYPGIYGRYQAIAYDFAACNDLATPAAPAILCFVAGMKVGSGKAQDKKKPRKPSRKNAWKMFSQYVQSGVIDRSAAVLTTLKSVHCPPMSGGDSMAKRVIETGEAELCVVTAEWFWDRLVGPNARAPAPTIWPALRIIDGPVHISLLAPQGVQIRYTIDGTDPTESSPVYNKPFLINGETKVKAQGFVAGRKSSGIAIGHYTMGSMPPLLTYPKRHLPPAQAGKPYTFNFTADKRVGYYSINGDLVPHQDKRSREAVTPNGMHLDPSSGVWTGTPTQPGRYWIQIATQEKPGSLARIKNFVWMVSGSSKESGSTQAADSVSEDLNRVVLQLTTLSDQHRAALQSTCEKAALDLVIQEGDDILLLVPEPQVKRAKQVILAYFGGALPTGVTWSP